MPDTTTAAITNKQKVIGWIKTLSTLGLIVLTIGVPELKAYETIHCITPLNRGLQKNWKVKQYQPVIDPITIPFGSPQYQAVLEAIRRMNLNPSQFRYGYGGMDNGDGVAIRNGESEIWMQDLGSNDAAISAVEQSDSEFSPTCTATESDIIINTQYRLARPPSGQLKFDYSNEKAKLFAYGGSNANLIAIVMHELGHSAGLHHEGDVLNLMGGTNLIASNGTKAEAYIGEDAATGLIALHGVDKQGVAEVSVSHWRHGDKLAARDGSIFSLHHRTRLFDGKGKELPTTCAFTNPDVNALPINSCPEPVYKVKSGQRIQAEFTFENAGSGKNIRALANFVLSEDNLIDSDDKPVHSRSLNLVRDGAPANLLTPITLPRTLQQAKAYWLGCLIQPATKLEESEIGNNAAYIGIKVE